MKQSTVKIIARAVWGEPVALASLLYVAILPAIFMLFRLNEPELASWKLGVFLIWAFLLIRFMLSRGGSGRERVKSADFKPRLWPAFWQVQGLALKLAFFFGIAVVLFFATCHIPRNNYRPRSTQRK